MTAKEKIQTADAKKNNRRMGTDILFAAFILVGISGFILLYMRATSDNTMPIISIWWWAFIHRISALVSLIFAIPHIYKFKKWYKKVFSSKRKSKITLILSISFFITLLTSIVLAFKRNDVLWEISHSLVGVIAVVLAITHALSKRHIVR